jgi:phage/plasmid primase-like uncharacterized protein
MSYTEKFRATIRDAGFNPPDVIEADGKLHRFSTNGKRSDDAGWYVFHGDGIPAGAFGDWRTGVNRTWRADIGRAFTPGEEAVHRAKVEAIRREREAEGIKRRAEAKAKAAEIWKAARPATAHPYLTSKRIKAHGARVHKGALVIPACAGGEIHSLQFIDADGQKKFLTDGRVEGCYFCIGKINEAQPLCIAEGFATGAAIHEATGYAVAVAFNAGNLEPVAQALRTKFAKLTLILCADDDVATAGNPGLMKATEAARAVKGKLAIPNFGADRPEGVSDFNDMKALCGAEAVARAITGATEPTTAGKSESIDWSEPKPIQAALHPVPHFDSETLLTDALRAWIMDEAERMPCPPDFIAATATVALGAIIGARCAIKPKANDDWLIVPNVWGGIVGLPSAKKSPAMNAALKPIDRLIARATEAHKAELEAFEAERTMFGAKKEAIEFRIKAAAKKGDNNDDVDSIAKELQSHRQQAPQAPIQRRYKTNDTTVEKLGELLRENPAGLLVLRDELVGLVASWEREGREGERAFFLEGWNGNSGFDTDRIKRGSIFIPNLCVSIFGGIQPDKLTMYLEQATYALANDGMLQRFQVLVYPDHLAWEWRDRKPAKDARDQAFAVFETLAEFDPVTWGATPADDFAKFPHFGFDQVAQAIFIEWSEDLHRSKLPDEDHPVTAQHLAKFDKLFPALALILHLIDCAATGRRGQVTKDAALRAAAWCDYLEAHARRCYGLLVDDGLRAAQALADKLRQGKLSDNFTARDVRRNQWHYLTTDGAVQAALDWLEDESWMKSYEAGIGTHGGRRTLAYRINPKLRSKNNSECADD